MNKKAQFSLRKSISWTILGVIVTIVVLFFAFTIAGYKNQLTYIPAEVKAEFIAERFVNNPDCFTYQDPLTERTYPGIIVLDNFNEERLFSCYHTEQ
ncbi:MAG: hypothetical protein KKH52_04520 [Nanoarchaeota archaeon]|nr:hypothetical protein [Nanoarchaeota archaeon]